MKADVVVIGGGPNGLAAAALLAKGGLEAIVLERREVVGGAAVTEEFHPGFRASTVAHTAGPLRSKLVAALDLHRHGLEWTLPEPRVFAPHPDGRGLRLFGDPARTAAELASLLVAKDAARYPEFHASLGRLVRGPRPPARAHPARRRAPDLRRPLSRWPVSAGRCGGSAARTARTCCAGARWPWPTSRRSGSRRRSCGAVIAARGIQGMAAGPGRRARPPTCCCRPPPAEATAPGSTVLVKGGLGALTAALASAARSLGAVVRTGAAVERLLRRDGRVAGVVLAGGEEIEARAVASAVDPQRTLLRLLDPMALDPDDVRRIRNFRTAGMASKVNLALSGLPRFAAAPTHAVAARPHPHRPRHRRARAGLRRGQVRRHLAAALSRRHDPDAQRPRRSRPPDSTSCRSTCSTRPTG